MPFELSREGAGQSLWCPAPCSPGKGSPPALCCHSLCLGRSAPPAAGALMSQHSELPTKAKACAGQYSVLRSRVPLSLHPPAFVLAGAKLIPFSISCACRLISALPCLPPWPLAGGDCHTGFWPVLRLAVPAGQGGGGRMESPGELGLAWVWEEEGSRAGCSGRSHGSCCPLFESCSHLGYQGQQKRLSGLVLLVPTCPRCPEMSWHCPAGQKVKGRTCFPVLIPRG